MQLKVAKVHKPGGKEKGMGVELNEVCLQSNSSALPGTEL
jgi:hypothetical protein